MIYAMSVYINPCGIDASRACDWEGEPLQDTAPDQATHKCRHVQNRRQSSLGCPSSRPSSPRTRVVLWKEDGQN